MFEHTQETEEISPKSYLEIKAAYLCELISNDHLKEAQEICYEVYKQITFQIKEDAQDAVAAITEITDEHSS